MEPEKKVVKVYCPDCAGSGAYMQPKLMVSQNFSGSFITSGKCTACRGVGQPKWEITLPSSGE